MTHDTYEIIRLTPRHVRARDLEPVAHAWRRAGAGHDSISRLAGKLFFDVEELLNASPDALLDEDLRGLFAEIDAGYPGLPLLLARDDEAGQMLLYASLLVPHTPEGDHIRFDKPRLERFALEKVRAMHALALENKLDARAAIRAFCAQLNLEVLEEVDAQKPRYPFEPERITSQFLIDFFKHGFHFHTIDSSDEPVLFVLVDDPSAAYYAKASLALDLFRSTQHPVIHMDFRVEDVPENPLTMAFFYNVEQAKHRQELSAYAEMAYLTTNFLFKSEGQLYYAFSRAVELPEGLRAKIPGLLQEASSLLRAIPKEARDFGAAIEEWFASQNEAPQEEEELPPPPAPEKATAKAKERSLSDLIVEEPAPSAPRRGATPTSSGGQFELPIRPPRHGAPQDSHLASAAREPEPELPEAEEPAFDTPSENRAEEAETASEGALGGSTGADILDEYEAEGRQEPATEASEESDDADLDALIGLTPRPLRAAPETNATPASVVPPNIQRISRALSKPVRRPDKAITEELALKPAPKRVVLRNEDQLERLARRLLITQSKLETAEREAHRLQAELKSAREESEKLRRENLDLESRWWKFWK